MKMTKEGKQKVREQYEKVWHGDAKIVDYCTKRTSGYIMLGDVMVTCDKPHIQTDFWFGEHTYDYDEVCQTAHALSSDEQYFIDTNLKNTKAYRFIEALTEGKYGYEPYLRDRKYSRQDDDCALGYIDWQRNWETNGLEVKKLDDDERARLLEFCKDELAKFEKRLRTYLKRYGLSKCHYGVYWADR